MRAITQRAYGLEHLEIEELDVLEPKPGHVRVRVEAASINPADWHRAMGEPKFMRLTEGWARPKQLVAGTDFCGVIDAIGDEVDGWEVGDRVYGLASGAFAESAIARADRIGPAAESASDAEMAALPIAAVTALQAVERGAVAGRRVVVNGASGGVGHLAVQIARAAGAAEVVAVCSDRNASWVAELGADTVIDYESADFCDMAYDVVIDCVGNRAPRDIARGMSPDGRWVLVGASTKTGWLGPLGGLVRAKLAWLLARRSCIVFIAEESTERLTEIARLVEDGSLRVRIAGSRPLTDIRDAYDRIESQRIAGKVVVTPRRQSSSAALAACTTIGSEQPRA
ncbi:MAG: NAD(P)-dependent alcohol dehydrogenase [Actinomycetota bacterium]